MDPAHPPRSPGPSRETPIDGLLEGKPEAFHRFYEAWFPRVWAFAYDVAGEDAGARRLTVATLERVVRDLPAFGRDRDEDAFARFVFARAVWASRDVGRSRGVAGR